MFTSVLIANRGEIAVRITRTLHARGLRAVAVYTDPDAGAPHVGVADVAVRVPDYLDGAAILAAGAGVGADAVHPGYGFLAENAGFARQVGEAGMTWIGPPPAAIEAMGDKIRAKATVGRAGVPLVPGSDGTGLDDAAVAAAAREVGFPVLLKPSAGGGGKGMHVVERDADLDDAIAAARREARSSFGDDTLLVERYVTDPRHIEIQVLADRHGDVVHLGERECSLQRRHQKVVEEAPSPALDATLRHEMGKAAVEAARACGYVGAGTVEFVVDGGFLGGGAPRGRLGSVGGDSGGGAPRGRLGSVGGDSGGGAPRGFYFLEMNTRLQVEHPVTEEVVRVRGAGIDLVAEQLRVAAGEPLGYGQDEVTLEGHAVEVRLYAEDPARGFLPTGGQVLDLVWPQHVRVDAGVATGTEVGSRYDPMLAKITAWGPDRAAALDRLDTALAATSVLGVRTNLSWLRTLLRDPDVRAGRLDTGLIGRLEPPTDEIPPDVLAAAALAGLLDLPAGDAPFDRLGGWRLGADPAPARWRLVPAAGASGHPVDVAVAGPPERASVTIGPEGVARAASAQRHGGTLVATLDGATRAYRTAVADGVRWLARDGGAWALREQERLRAARTAAGGPDGPLTAPMPGTVTAVEVAEGDHVVTGQRLVVVEAMKMEHVISAPVDGVVKDLAATAGAAVALDAPLVTVVPDSGE